MDNELNGDTEVFRFLRLMFSSISPAMEGGLPEFPLPLFFDPNDGEIIVVGAVGFSDIGAGAGGPPPASKASIDALKSVEIVGDCDDCPVCLDEFKQSSSVKEMPCRHRFHGDCIEKWLGIHGSCPVCQYRMPEEAPETSAKSGAGAGDDNDEFFILLGVGTRDR